MKTIDVSKNTKLKENLLENLTITVVGDELKISKLIIESKKKLMKKTKLQ